ncbi:ABC transporter permease subunit [Parendozoicomonas haliclonae]|uniref:Putrescine transport system permease protein PotH n=1 Tax=Parendozoicomonas haliclonae TaxID=1960125 RepID=A0A1X7ARL9_9GAMM|nr:ABC transporter permease subunit [Parendozoicomonas haliclonae]SMA50793.1 Putrescine transport system permease protein PotH [Parendozoicomonas haliclonae]
MSAFVQRLSGSLGRRTLIGIPFLWLLLFFLIPFAIVLKISFAEMQISIPPYSSVVEYADESLNIVLNLGNYLFLLDDDLYAAAYLSSIQIALNATLMALLLGYPMAYAMARAPAHMQTTLLLLILLPSWTSFLIRIYAWMGLLSNKGLINNALISLGVITDPIPMMNTNFAVYIGMVYAYLPFVILPIYANLIKHDQSLLEAAADLGCPPWKAFLTITLPLSKAGILAGFMLMFIPAVGEFVIPELLGGPDTLMIGKVLWQEFFNNRDWPVAASLAMVMLLLLIIPIMIFHRQQAKELEAA